MNYKLLPNVSTLDNQSFMLTIFYRTACDSGVQNYLMKYVNNNMDAGVANKSGNPMWNDVYVQDCNKISHKYGVMFGIEYKNNMNNAQNANVQSAKVQIIKVFNIMAIEL